MVYMYSPSIPFNRNWGDTLPRIELIKNYSFKVIARYEALTQSHNDDKFIP